MSSNFQGEGTVTYTYSGDQKRRSRSVSGGATTKYRFDHGWNVLNEEDGTGALQLTYIEGMATSAGSTASSGTWNYYFQDGIGSTRSLWDEDGDRLGKYDYTPFGGKYGNTGEEITRKFTGHDWDNEARLYHTAYRQYSPDTGRWLTRDPLGMVDGPNVYAYVVNNPVTMWDALGLCGENGADPGIEPIWQSAYVALVFLLAAITVAGALAVLAQTQWGGSRTSVGISIGICVGAILAAAFAIAQNHLETGSSAKTWTLVLGLGAAVGAACVGTMAALLTTPVTSSMVISGGIMAERVVRTSTLGARLFRGVSYGASVGVPTGAAISGVTYEILTRLVF